MIARFVRRQHTSALSWIADRAGRIASLLLPQVGDVHDLFRACETAERVLRVGPDQRFASTLVDMGRRQPCVATDLKPSSSDPQHPELCLADAGCVRQHGFKHWLQLARELESFSGPRLVSSTARRYGISTSLLSTWRRTRDVCGGPDCLNRFSAAMCAAG